jgi:hypothetical protein
MTELRKASSHQKRKASTTEANQRRTPNSDSSHVDVAKQYHDLVRSLNDITDKELRAALKS